MNGTKNGAPVLYDNSMRRFLRKRTSLLNYI